MKHILTLMLLFTALPTFADVKTRDGKVIDCYCTDRTGSRVEMGETICLQVDGRMFMAQCQMSLNVPMWREVQKGCLSSGLQSVDPSFDAGTIDAGISTAKS